LANQRLDSRRCVLETLQDVETFHVLTVGIGSHVMHNSKCKMQNPESPFCIPFRILHLASCILHFAFCISNTHVLRELPPLLKLAGPVILAEIGWMVMGIVDTMMVGP